MYMKNIKLQGFTLIELLVVIAIIGILAAVVLASLNDARKSGSDSAVTQAMVNSRAQAQIVYNKGAAFSYALLCTDLQTLKLMRSAASSTSATVTVDGTLTNIGVAGTSGKVSCHVSTTGADFAIAAPLPSDPNKFWCVDSTGVSRKISVVLPASQAFCP